ncbi:hypothetical protein DL93DRAFT_2069513, partial [Clavulina sp. PMI_390]
KITGYRILTTTVLLGFGLAKASLSYMGWTVVPITLEWVVGVFVATALYWIGFYEAPRTKVSPAFFQRDYSDKISFGEQFEYQTLGLSLMRLNFVQTFTYL